MKILLVQAYLGRREKEGALYPIGLAYLASVLGRKHEVKILDPNLYENPLDEVASVLNAFKPDVVGISQRNIDTTQLRDLFLYINALEPTVRLVRKTLPSAKILVGGSGFSLFPERIMQSIPEIDCGVYLEGEESLPELLDNLATPEKVKGLYIRKNGNVVFTGLRMLPNFDALPFPDRNTVSKYTVFHPLAIGVQTKRGCPLGCTYCSYPHLNGKGLRLRTPSRVVDEIEDLVKNHGVKSFSFLDSVFNLPRSFAVDICNELAKRKLGVTWSGWYSPIGFDEELFAIARNAGCEHFAFSPDAITNQSLKMMGKEFTEDDVQRVFSIARRHKDGKFGFSFFCNTPGLNFKGYLKLLLFFIKGNLLLFGRGGVGLSWVRIEPFTKIKDQAIKDGIINETTDLFATTPEELGKLFYLNPKLKLEDFITHKLLDSVKFAGRLMGKKVKHV